MGQNGFQVREKSFVVLILSVASRATITSISTTSRPCSVIPKRPEMLAESKELSGDPEESSPKQILPLQQDQLSNLFRNQLKEWRWSWSQSTRAVAIVVSATVAMFRYQCHWELSNINCSNLSFVGTRWCKVFQVSKEESWTIWAMAQSCWQKDRRWQGVVP